MKPQTNTQSQPSDKQYAEARAAAYKTSYDAAFKLGAAAERDRVRAILTSDSAVGRTRTALAFSCDTDLTPAQAERALAATPKGYH